MEHPYEGFVNNLSFRRRRPRQYIHKTGCKITFIQHLGPFAVIQMPIFGAAFISGFKNLVEPFEPSFHVSLVGCKHVVNYGE